MGAARGRALIVLTALLGIGTRWPYTRNILVLTIQGDPEAAHRVVATLGWLMPLYPAAFYLAVAQIAMGFLLFNAVNLKPKKPSLIVAFHQSMRF